MLPIELDCFIIVTNYGIYQICKQSAVTAGRCSHGVQNRPITPKCADYRWCMHGDSTALFAVTLRLYRASTSRLPRFHVASTALTRSAIFLTEPLQRLYGAVTTIIALSMRFFRQSVFSCITSRKRIYNTFRSYFSNAIN